MMKTKVCTNCGEEKELTEYPVRADSPDGFRNHCYVCRKAQNVAWYQKNKERQLAKRKAYREANYEAIKLAKHEAYWADPEKQRKKGRDYYWENWEKVRENSRRANLSEQALANVRASDLRYNRANKEKLYAKRRLYYSDPENVMKRRESQQAAREANREHYRSENRKWRKANPDKIRALENLKSIRRKAVETDNHTMEELHVYWKANGMDPKRCTYCDAWHTKWIRGGWKVSVGDHVVPLSKGGKDFIENIVPCCFSCNCSKGAKILYEEWTPPKERIAV
jgi:hypothetical protein